MNDLFSHASAQPEQPAPEGRLTTVSLRAEVLRLTYTSDDAQYSVLKARHGEFGEITLVGPWLAGMVCGDTVEASGHWERHAQHGRQFRVDFARSILPSTQEGMVSYLSSTLPGIGRGTAEKIVAHFQERTFAILDAETARLAEVPGIGKKRIAQIAEVWRESRSEHDVLLFLQSLGLSPKLSAKVHLTYGPATAAVIRDNPYSLIRDIKGVGFILADRIARSLGIAAEHPFRLASGFSHLMDALAENGHTCCPRDELLQRGQRLLEVDAAAAQTGLERALLDGALVSCEALQQTWIYDRRSLDAELDLAQHLHRLAGWTDLTAPFGPVSSWRNATLNQEQRQAVESAFTRRLSIITGGPGVGKTTTIAEIVSQARQRRMKLKLAAPTGRAAKRMAETTGHEATTIHRLLMPEADSGLLPSQGQEQSFAFGPDRRLDCDLIVIDEISMLDLHLASKLFAAIDPIGTSVVLVGDPDQLPSVGPGAVLADILHARLCAATRLHQVFRQAQASRIIANAHRINQGRLPELANPPRGEISDFYFIEQDDPDKIPDLINRLLLERIPQRFALEARDIQVLSPMNRHSCGAETLNLSLQACLNSPHQPQFKHGERRFLLGDRVLQRKNNYEKRVFNGDLGYITQIDAAEERFSITFDHGIVRYDYIEADQISLAYAITIHKSQGSEFPAVIVPITTQHAIMLQRNLIYTAITRARKLLILVGSREAIRIATQNTRRLQRHTLLAARLQEPR